MCLLSKGLFTLHLSRLRRWSKGSLSPGSTSLLHLSTSAHRPPPLLHLPKASKPNWSPAFSSDPPWLPLISKYFRLSFRQFYNNNTLNQTWDYKNSILEKKHDWLNHQKSFALKRSRNLYGRQCCYNGGGAKTVGDHGEVGEVPLDAWIKDRLGPRVAEGRPVLVQQVHQLLADKPEWNNDVWGGEYAPTS